MPWEQGIDAFFSWLRENFPEGVILVAHGAFANDAPLIVDDLQDSGWSDEQIQKVIVGFCDTLHAFTKNFPGIAFMDQPPAYIFSIGQKLFR